MRTLLSKATAMLVILVMTLTLSQSFVFGDTYEFDPSGTTKNPFYPRGYQIEKNGKRYWLSSPFSTSGTTTRYTGVLSGLDYIDAEQAGTLYALTDRNPTPGKQYLSAYKNGEPISGFSSYIGTPTRADIQTTGKSSGWKIPINMKLEAGCRYEFAFLRGMMANNGITLVFSEDGRGYIQNPSTKAEKAKYEADKYEEYEFIVSYEKDKDPETNQNHYFNFYIVPMRFTVQTYADLGTWEKAADEAQSFLDSVTDQDFQEGKYKRANVNALRELLTSLDKKAKTTVKKELQPEAEAQMKDMAAQLGAMLKKAKSEKPEPADISRLKAKLKEAKELYAKASVNTGAEIGQYGAFEVENLKIEIDAAEEMDQFTPQNEINDQVEALDSAIKEVKKSRRMEDALYFYDKATGIYVIAPIDSLPEDAKLFVRRMSPDSREYKAMEKNLSKTETEAIFYKIQFYQDEYKISPSEAVEVQMPIDTNISRTSSRIYSVDEEGGLTEIRSARAGENRVFKSKALGDLVLAGSTATEEEKAQARSDRIKQLMNQDKDNDQDNKEMELAKAKKKKEEFKDPLDKLLKRSQNTAVFSSDVKIQTDPFYLIIVAVLLAAAAVILALRGIREGRIGSGRKRQTQGGKHA